MPTDKSDCTFRFLDSIHTHSILILHTTMPQLTAIAKHHILIHCQSRGRGETDVSIARRHGVVVSSQTIRNWRSRWDGTPQSLERADTAGRPHILTQSQIQRYISAPILAANREHRAINYSTLLRQIREKTGKSISLRTLQRIGKKELGIRWKHTQIRTKQECKSIRTYE